jgi:hypothetical protein
MKKKIEEEQKFLKETEELIVSQLAKSNNLKDCKRDAFTNAKIKAIISRMFNQEVDYLHDDPTTYFDIYGEDHLMN